MLGENEGWKLITSQLNHERVALAPGRQARSAARSRYSTWAQATRARPTARAPIDHEWVQVTLGRVHATAEALKLANWRVAAALDAGTLQPGATRRR